MNMSKTNNPKPLYSLLNLSQEVLKQFTAMFFIFHMRFGLCF